MRNILLILAASLATSMLCSPVSAKVTSAGVWRSVDRMESTKDYGFVELNDDLNISTADVKQRYGAPDDTDEYHLQHPPRTVTVWRYKRPSGTLEFRFFLGTNHVNQIELKKPTTTLEASAKYTVAGTWIAVDRLEKKPDYNLIRVPDYLNISTTDIKKRYGEPTEVEHYKLMDPPTTGTIWRYKRPNGVLEFRFFLDTKHVNQIELKKAK